MFSGIWSIFNRVQKKEEWKTRTTFLKSACIVWSPESSEKKSDNCPKLLLKNESLLWPLKFSFDTLEHHQTRTDDLLKILTYVKLDIRTVLYKIENALCSVNVVINPKRLKNKAPLRNVSHQLNSAWYHLKNLVSALDTDRESCWSLYSALPRGQSNHNHKIYV